MASTVTLKRPHFETLLRRAELHSPEKADLKHIPTIAIPELEYQKLLRIARDFANLKESLCKGGISEDTLEILIRGDGPTYDAEELSANGHNFEDVTSVSHASRAYDASNPGYCDLDSLTGHQSAPRKLWADEPYQASTRSRPKLQPGHGSFRDDSCFSPDFDREDASIATTRADRTFYAKKEQRTLLLKGLPESVTHEDIVKVLKGGLILDVYVRANDRSASVSFVEGNSAQQFLTYSRRDDLYIGGKRIEVQWNDRQFTLPGHVASKIGIGATRNLVIHSPTTTITESGVRDDLDHIHNLVVISIKSRESDMHIELNSIHNALFARTCMMSRAKYKGLKIEWSTDECAQPLPVAQPKIRKGIQDRNASLKPIAPANRFHMLDVDGTEDGSSDDEARTETTLSDMANLNMQSRSLWNRRAIAT